MNTGVNALVVMEPGGQKQGLLVKDISLEDSHSLKKSPREDFSRFRPCLFVKPAGLYLLSEKSTQGTKFLC